MRNRLPVIPLIILANVIVFLMWNFSTSAETEPTFMIDHFLVSWSGLLEGRVWILLTSVFSHNLFWHLFLNMLVFFSFAPIIEKVLGTWRFLGFYLAAGIFSSLCHALVSAFLLHQPDLPALGASGAISGVILLFSLLFPKEKLLLFGIIPMPAIFGALLFVGLDIWGLIAQTEGGGLPIGHGAHLGGALAGLIYYLHLRKRFRRA